MSSLKLQGGERERADVSSGSISDDQRFFEISRDVHVRLMPGDVPLRFASNRKGCTRTRRSGGGIGMTSPAVLAFPE